MARRRKPQDPTYALIEQMVEKSGLSCVKDPSSTISEREINCSAFISFANSAAIPKRVRTGQGGIDCVSCISIEKHRTQTMHDIYGSD